MRIKVFYPNDEGKIEFTREELEKLINEVYNEGKSDGTTVYPITYPTYPTITNPYYQSPYITCSDNTTDMEITIPEGPMVTSTTLKVSNESSNSFASRSGVVYCTNDDSIGKIYLQDSTLAELGMERGNQIC